MRKSIIYSLVILLGTIFYGQAQNGNNIISNDEIVITGKVTSEEGKSVKAKIKLIEVASNKVVAEIEETNPAENNHFELKGNYPKGKYLFYVQASGYMFYSTLIRIGDSENTPKILDIMLKKQK